MSAATDGQTWSTQVARDGRGESSREREISARVAYITGNRTVIEQAKGMLMFIYGVDGDTAFEILRKQSQDHNIKLYLLAEQIARDLVELSDSTSLERRLKYDELLATAHKRIANAAVRQLDGADKTDG